MRPSFEHACRCYVHRYTMEHVPRWASAKAPAGQFYAPHFATDREWYDNSLFPGEDAFKAIFIGNTAERHCYTRNQTWPLGQWLAAPFKGR